MVEAGRPAARMRAGGAEWQRRAARAARCSRGVRVLELEAGAQAKGATMGKLSGTEILRTRSKGNVTMVGVPAG